MPLVVVLRCTFCGYFNDTRDDVTNEDLHAQWEAAKAKFEDFKDQAMVKVYTSGSLLEDREIPVEFQETVLRDCAEMDKELIVESRCEQLTEEKLAWATSINPDFTVAIWTRGLRRRSLAVPCQQRVHHQIVGSGR